MRILHVVGARPNFMKVAPVMAALDGRKEAGQTLVHTGQHYDIDMSDVFFRQLGIPAPDINLEVGSASQARQTADIMSRFEPVVLRHKPDWVLVYGDVNSTLAAAVVCSKLAVSLAHVEAGLRSFDRSMPEEINRLVTDQLSDLLFTPSEDADENLLREGIDPGKIHRVGNVMIDTLVRLLPAAERISQKEMAGDKEGDQRNSDSLLPLGGRNCSYGVVTLHRPANVDDLDTLSELMRTLVDISRTLPLVFPIHPRTRERISSLDLPLDDCGMRLVNPIGYLEFLALQRGATLVITDSGGIQEETAFLGVPCLTIRENTERPITVTQGTNIVVGRKMDRLRAEVDRILAGKAKQGRIPPLWDGRAAERIADVIAGVAAD